jgi:CrcB protein
MRDLLLVGSGGFLGAVARYALSQAIPPTGTQRFPLATLVVNVTGCLAIGLLAGLSERSAAMSPATRLFLMTGLLGGYTTFSAFALETHTLARGQWWWAATLNVAAQIVLGLLAAVVGYRLGSLSTA